MEEELLRAVCAISLMQPENAANGAGGAAAACALPQGPPDHFICPISLDVMQDPVIVVQSGITYERALIEQAMRFNPCRDPATNQEWSEPLTLAPNVLVRKMIREWQQSRRCHRRRSPRRVRSSLVAAALGGSFGPNRAAQHKDAHRAIAW